MMKYSISRGNSPVRSCGSRRLALAGESGGVNLLRSLASGKGGIEFLSLMVRRDGILGMANVYGVAETVIRPERGSSGEAFRFRRAILRARRVLATASLAMGL